MIQKIKENPITTAIALITIILLVVIGFIEWQVLLGIIFFALAVLLIFAVFAGLIWESEKREKRRKTR